VIVNKAMLDAFVPPASSSTVINVIVIDDSIDVWPGPDGENKQLITVSDDPASPNHGWIGWTWDGTKFIPPQPYPSWTYNAETNSWEAPVPYPTDGGSYRWDEDTLSWVIIT
jgi:hypothetical protein